MKKRKRTKQKINYRLKNIKTLDELKLLIQNTIKPYKKERIKIELQKHHREYIKKRMNFQ